MINGGSINASPINAPHGEPFIDWSIGIDPITTKIYYALDLDDGILEPIRVPMSSWQATLQIGRANFLQAVIPAAGDWLSAINDRIGGDMIVSRGVRYENGTTQESEMARTPLQTSRYQTGPNRTTVTLSGYGQSPLALPAIRTLRNVRSVTVEPGIRVRCEIDWFLRPGQTALWDGQPFTVAYINYYANASDEYMDVGERAL